MVSAMSEFRTASYLEAAIAWDSGKKALVAKTQDFGMLTGEEIKAGIDGNAWVLLIENDPEEVAPAMEEIKEPETETPSAVPDPVEETVQTAEPDPIEETASVEKPAEVEKTEPIKKHAKYTKIDGAELVKLLVDEGLRPAEAAKRMGLTTKQATQWKFQHKAKIEKRKAALAEAKMLAAKLAE